MKYFLGIDGGGTKTTVAVANEKGEIIYKTSGKTINFYATGMTTARENLKSVVDNIKTEKGIDEFYAVFIGCSALDGKGDERTIGDLCSGVIKAQKIGLDSDIYVALKASGSNCVAICGTGSIVLGERRDGTLLVKGGWGHILGDEGSAYSIATSALKICCTQWDKGQRTALVERALSYFGVEDLRKIIDLVYSSEKGKDYVAGFAREVDKLSLQGCEDSKEILTVEAKRFGKTVIALIKELENVTKISLYGGVFENSVLFRNVFAEEIKLFAPEISTEILCVPPEEGAVKAAMEL